MTHGLTKARNAPNPTRSCGDCGAVWHHSWTAGDCPDCGSPEVAKI